MSYGPLATYKPNRLLLLPDLILDWREPSLCPGDSELSSPRGSKISAVSSHSLSFVSPSRASLRRSDHARRPYERRKPPETQKPSRKIRKLRRAQKLCIMIGGLTAGQFAIFDSMLPAIGIDKFHYHEPHAEH